MASTVKGLEASEQVIEITLGANGKPTATPDFDISKSSNQMVRWICNIPSARFTVDFGDKSPFYESHFNNANPLSGLVNRDLRVPAGGKTFQYTVTLNGTASDPQGQVDP